MENNCFINQLVRLYCDLVYFYSNPQLSNDQSNVDDIKIYLYLTLTVLYSKITKKTR